MNEAAPQGPPRALVLWIIWFALVAAVPFYVVFLGGGWPTGKNPPDAPLPAMFLVGLAELIGATAIRWFVLPRFQKLQQKLVWMVVGLSLSEGPVFYSIFLIPRSLPETRMLLIVLCVLSLLQFIPLYAREPEPDPWRRP